jgi:hypothetical protein
MAKAGYTVISGQVSLAAASTRTVLALIAPSTFGLDLTKVRIGFDGSTNNQASVVVDLCAATFATNSTPGTNNTAVTPNQIYGRQIAVGATAFAASATGFEPTVLTVLSKFPLSPQGGLVMYDIPLGTTPDSPVSQGFVLRCTTPTGVSVNAYGEFTFERC